VREPRRPPRRGDPDRGRPAGCRHGHAGDRRAAARRGAAPGGRYRRVGGSRRAQTALAALQNEKNTLSARADVLAGRALKLTAIQQEAAATLTKTQALVDRVAAAAYKGSADDLIALMPSGDMLALARRMKLAGQAGTSLREISRAATTARSRASKSAEKTALEMAQVQERLTGLNREITVAERTVQSRTAQATSDLPAGRLRSVASPSRRWTRTCAPRASSR